ncbi:MAG: leucine-rich repeat protein [Ruminococcus sp.]|nr:leucine-rich repeat protein [Ruminococcus sp.]
MKRLFISILSVMIAVSLSLSFTAVSAEGNIDDEPVTAETEPTNANFDDVTVNGVVLSWNNNNEWIVTGSVDGYEVIEVPAEYNGKSVFMIEIGAFSKNKTVKKVIVPDSVQYISRRSFAGCTSLEEVVLPDNSLQQLGDGAFADCTSLKKINIPSGITEIGNDTFMNTGFTRFEIPDNITDVGRNAFKNCKFLRYLTIGSGVRMIGSQAFSNCLRIQNVYIKDMSKWCGISFSDFSSNPLYYAEYLYLNGEKTVDVFIPDDTQRVSSMAFVYYYNLNSVTFGSGIKEIGDKAFYNCYNLIKVQLSDSVTDIGEESFHNCQNLKTVSFGDGVKQIKQRAFFYCPELRFAALPASIERIGNEALGYLSDDIVNGFAIYGYKGTAAETYAEKSRITFYDIETMSPPEITEPTEPSSSESDATHPSTSETQSTEPDTGEVAQPLPTEPTAAAQPAKVVKKTNTIKVTVKSKTVEYTKLKKAKQTVTPITVRKAQGKVVYKKMSGSKKLTLKSNGTIVIKKGTKKGIYTCKIMVTAKGNSKYKSLSKTVAVEIKVK